MSRRRRPKGGQGRGSGRKRQQARLPWVRIAILIGAGSVVLGIVVVLLLSLGGDDARPPANEESVMQGAVLFENNCQVCHGPTGEGSDLAPDLTIHIPTREDEFLFRRISEGFEGTDRSMPAFKDELSETERWHLVNFLREEFGEIDFVVP